MAVFTADGTMGRIFYIVILVLVAFPADRRSLVFYRILFPLGLVGYAVPAIHIAPLVDAKIFWN
jgi:hypothetical protein